MELNMSYSGEALLAAVFLLCGLVVCLSLAALKLVTGSSGSYSQIETARKVFIRARTAMLIAAGLFVVAFGLLIIAFLTDDFSVAAVARYSSAGLPFFYKLSAVWAGSGGSLLLWSVGVFVLFGLWLAKTEADEIRFDAVALAIGAGICLGFSALLVFVVKPFAGSPVTVDDGAGLNPLLQNFWMIIHPPLLFIGYSAFLVPFVIALAGVFAGRTAAPNFYNQLRHWLLFGVCFMGPGIVTGARWSYLELGWGGYWAWDPVENASLLPWLLAIAALHSIVGIRIASKFRRWAVVLAPVPFILCLVATFITRSGILQSVHAFGQNPMFWALLAFLGCCFLLWALCIVRAVRTVSVVSQSRVSVFELEKSNILFWATIIFISTAVVIGAGTFWPIASQVFTGSDSPITLTRVFYDRVVSVAGILLAFIVGFNILLDFQKFGGFRLQLWSCCAVGLLCFGFVSRLPGVTLLQSLACGICAFSFVAVLIKLWFRLKFRGRIGGDIAHLGLLVLVVAAGFSSNEETALAQLSKGEKISLGGYTILYDSFEHKLLAGVTKVGPEIIVTKKGLTKKLWPHNNLYPNGQSTSEVAVHTGLLKDIYISFDGAAEDLGSVVITAKLKPLMLWLWLAALFIVGGSALAMLEGKSKK